MRRTRGRCIRLLLTLAVAGGAIATMPGRAEAQAPGCAPPATNAYANTGPFAVATESDSVTTFYFPSQLGTGGCTRHPVILWGNGTFTTPTVYDGLLRHWASHGFIVAAANTSNAGSGQEMLQGLDTLTRRNGQSGDRFYQKVDVERVATTGHSQGGFGAVRAAQDPRIDTTYPVQGGSAAPPRGPAIFFAGETDPLAAGNRTAFEAASGIPAAYAELAGAGHLVPLGNGGGFRGPTTAWVRWHLMGDSTARGQFVGATCGLCNSPTWSEYEANALLQQLGGGGDPDPDPDPDPGQCVTATNSSHVEAGRASSFLVFAFARGSGDYLGLTWATTSLRRAGSGWELVTAC
jgi:hypothetical protein